MLYAKHDVPEIILIVKDFMFKMLKYKYQWLWSLELWQIVFQEQRLP